MTLLHRTERAAFSGRRTLAASVNPDGRPRVFAGRRHGSRRFGATVAMLVTGAVLVSGAVLGTPLAAHADGYPSFADVQAAMSNAAAKQSEITNIQGLIASLQSDVAAKQAAETQAGADLQKAQTSYDEAKSKAADLQSQADDATRVAKASEARAGQLAAQLGRSGSSTISSSLIANPGKAGNLLYKLGAMSKLTQQADGIYSGAVQDHNTAQSLTDQADVAAKALADLAAKAQTALEDAQNAATAAQAAVDAQSANEDRLNVQLASLQNDVAVTQAGYDAGVAAAKAAAAAAAAAKAAAAAAAAAAQGASGVPVSSGWTRPAGGSITSGYGWRVDPYTHQRALHAGTDLGASCGSPIYAAYSGKVIYAGAYGGYGNFVLLDNGNNISTGYGHIVNGGIKVSVGQSVTSGQVIAAVGSTGWSTGCHLHFETRVGGVAQDAVPFMSARGVSL